MCPALDFVNLEADLDEEERMIRDAAGSSSRNDSHTLILGQDPTGIPSFS